MASLYNLRHDGDQYRVTKFDTDLNVESSYLMTATECTCPAGSRPTCRHRQMFRDLLPRIGSHWMWDFDHGQWIATAEEDEDVVSMTPAPDLSQFAKDEDVTPIEPTALGFDASIINDTDPDHSSPSHIHHPHPQWRRV